MPRQDDLARLPDKQGQAEVFLQLADLVADGGRCDAKLGGGELETFLTGGGFESP